MIERPARVCMRARNPCLRARRRLLGWNVRFTTGPSGRRARVDGHAGAVTGSPPDRGGQAVQGSWTRGATMREVRGERIPTGVPVHETCARAYPPRRPTGNRASARRARPPSSPSDPSANALRRRTTGASVARRPSGPWLGPEDLPRAARSNVLRRVRRRTSYPQLWTVLWTSPRWDARIGRIGAPGGQRPRSSAHRSTDRTHRVRCQRRRTGGSACRDPRRSTSRPSGAMPATR